MVDGNPVPVLMHVQITNACASNDNDEFIFFPFFLLKKFIQDFKS
jgi:hypothetical protein